MNADHAAITLYSLQVHSTYGRGVIGATPAVGIDDGRTDVSKSFC